MKRLLCLIIMTTSLHGWANNPDLNETLVRIINQINAIMPLLDEAQTQITPNARIQLQLKDLRMHKTNIMQVYEKIY